MQETLVNENSVSKGAEASRTVQEAFFTRFLKGGSPELDPVLRLRYRVFNLEMNEGLLRSHMTGKDEDRFDAHCDHLVLYERESGEPVGTYRLQTFEMAQAHAGFYSATEFDFSIISRCVLEQSVEIGRACIAKEHRNIQVLFLLWKGLMRYLETHQKRRLFGCTSLNSRSPREGWRAFEYFCERKHMHPGIFVCAEPDFLCVGREGDPETPGEIKIPRLLRVYLNFGARICSEPAIDRAFNTIDFLTLLDINDLDEKTFDFFSC